MQETQTRYRLFFDESGDRGAPKGTNPHSFYLSLGGCVFLLNEYQNQFVPHFEAFRKNHFERDRDNPVILHREEISGKRGAFASLQDETKRAAFDTDLLKLIADSQYYVITVVLDKQSFFAYCGENADPHVWSLSVLLGRYCSFLMSKGGSGDVMGEARQEYLDRAMRRAYSCYWDEYTKNHPSSSLLTSKDLKLKPKEADIPGIQLADLLAYPMKQDVLRENRRIEIEKVGPFTSQICDKIRNKYIERQFLQLYNIKKTGTFLSPGSSAVLTVCHSLQRLRFFWIT